MPSKDLTQLLNHKDAGQRLPDVLLAYTCTDCTCRKKKCCHKYKKKKGKQCKSCPKR